MDVAVEFNPSRYSFDELYKVLDEIRRSDPFFWSKRYNAWVATTYEDVLAVVRSDHFSIGGVLDAAQPHGYCAEARRVLQTGVDWLVTENLLTGEGASHRRFRGAITSVLTPSRLREMDAIINGIVDDLIDGMVARGECDFVPDFAYPLAMLTTLRMIGFDEAEQDMDKIPLWADETFKFFVKAMDDEEQVVAARHAVAFQNYVRKHIDARLAAPRDDRLGRVIATLASVPWSLNVDEMIITFTHTFVGAGQETTKLALSNMMLHLLSDRAHSEAIVAAPHAIKDYVDEVLRLDGPLLGIYRTCVEDATVRDKQVKRGDKVFVLLGSANHDPARFDRPDEICPFRGETAPMMTFNTGKHFCVGAGLAKMEMAATLRQLVERLPSIRLKGGQAFVYEANDVNRFLSSLRLEWDERAVERATGRVTTRSDEERDMPERESVGTVMLFCAVDGGADAAARVAATQMETIRAALAPALELRCYVRVAGTGLPPSLHQELTAGGPPPADLVVTIVGSGKDGPASLSAAAGHATGALGPAIDRARSSIFAGREIKITKGDGPALLVMGIRRRSDQSHAAFMHHWYDRHADIGEGVSGVRYRQCHVDTTVTEALAAKLGFSNLMWDGVTLSFFDDVKGAVTLMSNDQVVDAIEDEKLFIDHPSSNFAYYVMT